MIKCKIKNDIKVGSYKIKAGTQGRSLYDGLTPNCCISAQIIINSWDLEELQDYIVKNNKSCSLDGILISLETKNILLEANYINQNFQELYNWQVEKVLGFIPKTFKSEFGRYKLGQVIDYLNDEMSDWVEKNGVFETVTQDMLDNGDVCCEFNEGDSMLSNLEEFAKENERLNKKLECIGFYYDFNGGLQFFD